MIKQKKLERLINKRAHALAGAQYFAIKNQIEILILKEKQKLTSDLEIEEFLLNLDVSNLRLTVNKGF